jgi:hypothetical protein
MTYYMYPGVFALWDYAPGDVISEFRGRRCLSRDDAKDELRYTITFRSDSGNVFTHHYHISVNHINSNSDGDVMCCNSG